VRSQRPTAAVTPVVDGRIWARTDGVCQAALGRPVAQSCHLPTVDYRPTSKPPFSGKHIVESALARGWKVTTFNRGLSGRDKQGTSATEP
jgi:hypothetical protein